MKKLLGKFTFAGLLTVALLCLCAGLTLAGVIHPAVAALPFIGIGAVNVRSPMENVFTVRYTSSSATTSGVCYLLGGKVVLAMNTALANAPNLFMYDGIVEYAKGAGAITALDTLYWDDTNKVFTKTSTSNTKAGIAMQDQASGDATCLVYICPQP